MQHATVTQPTGSTLSAKEMGAEMARLRAQFGLSQQQISQRLHIRTRYIVAMETGKLEDLPGKVYARGYVHTYAEFLGLNPELTVERCFAGEGTVASTMRHRGPPSVRPGLAFATTGRMRGIALLALILFALVMILGQGTEHDPASVESKETAVVPVLQETPKAVRTLVMPTPRNIDCLMTKALLGCYFDDGRTRAIDATWSRPYYFAQDVDVRGLELPEPVAVPEAETIEEPPASPEPAPAVSTSEPPAETPPND